MSEESILTDLLPDGIADCHADFGSYSVESLCASLSHTSAEIEEASFCCQRFPRPEALKTLLHEMTHHLHNVGTSFGFLIYLARLVQFEVAADFMLLFLSEGFPLRAPLVRRIEALRKPVQRNAQHLLCVWYQLETFALLAYGDADRSLAHQTANIFVQGQTMPMLFARVQATIVDYYQRKHSQIPELFIETGDMFAGFLRDEDDVLFDQREAAAERLFHGMDHFGLPYNLVGILESAGKTSEYLGDDQTRLDDFRAVCARKACSMRESHVLLPLQRAIDAIPARSLQEFVLSYLTICDLALNGLVLPMHRKLRKQPLRMSQLMPANRWFNLLDAARTVRPMEDREDYLRYASALRERLGWPTLSDQLDAERSLPVMEEVRRCLYSVAQSIRSDKPNFFLDAAALVTNPAPGLFFAAVDCGDGKTIHSPFSQMLTQEYLMRACFRKLMIGKGAKLHVSLPYNGNSKEIAQHQEFLRAILRYKWQDHFPAVFIETCKQSI